MKQVNYAPIQVLSILTLIFGLNVKFIIIVMHVKIYYLFFLVEN